ncbi:unnamed protein product [Echinostoma caproni]|uniref:2-hydroxyacyl-CoA lyase 2 n=1 Tax=Echinostoma caproni TaxID=27848 RepID=A0A183AMZ3_9TREM|nr:unnamed protein product [Echinostoma caproni]
MFRFFSPGPVLVEFPIDTLYPYGLVRQHLRISDNPQSWRQRFTNWYLRFYLFRLFANGFQIKPCLPGQEPTQIPVLVPSIPWPSTKSIDQLVWLLSQAKRPVVVVSSQALLPPVPAAQTAEYVKSLRVPVYLTGMARGLLGRQHPCAFRHARRAALRVADLIILAGTVCDFRMDYGRVLNRKAKIVIINRDKKQLYLNSLTQPIERINPLSVLWQLEHKGLTDHESIIVADGGDFVGSAAYILRPRGPLSWLDPGPFGTLGVGGGFALGAKLCRPEANVWVVYGDGSSAYSLAEWDTMARHRAPAIGVIGNDACWSQIARDQMGLFGSNVACGLQSTRYDLVGAAYAGADIHDALLKSGGDCGGFTVTEKNLDKLPELMAQARELSCRGTPSIINCHIAASGFREGSISL